jgi:hypothetical protein
MAFIKMACGLVPTIASRLSTFVTFSNVLYSAYEGREAAGVVGAQRPA